MPQFHPILRHFYKVIKQAVYTRLLCNLASKDQNSAEIFTASYTFTSTWWVSCPRMYAMCWSWSWDSIKCPLYFVYLTPWEMKHSGIQGNIGWSYRSHPYPGVAGCLTRPCGLDGWKRTVNIKLFGFVAQWMEFYYHYKRETVFKIVVFGKIVNCALALKHRWCISEHCFFF